MPEAAEGGPLALVKDGDIIAIDLNQRQMDLKVDASELEQRLKAWSPPTLPTEYGWLSMYWQLVQPLSKGAVLGDRSRS
jgi:dihydroxy-acid dehydratase